MSTIKFISNNKIKITLDELLELKYPELIAEKYDCDFCIEIDGKTFFNCDGNTFALMEFLQGAVGWIYKKDSFFYNSIETEDNPLISFVKEDDGLYSVRSPWQKFECNEHFTFDELKTVLDLADIKLSDDKKDFIMEENGYKFLVDIEKTKEYYKTHTLCDCSACRNFYLQINDILPSVSMWLKNFGVDITRPDETSWIQNDDDTISYDACYTVCGKILENGKNEFDFNDNVFTSAVVTNPDDVLGYFPNEQQGDYFGIIFYNINLPWNLNESLPEDKAPGQIKQRLQSMIDKAKARYKHKS